MSGGGAPLTRATRSSSATRSTPSSVPKGSPMTALWQLHSPPVVPRSRPPGGSELVRLRLPDRPGSLAAVLGHLADHGVDVLALEVLDRSSGVAVDDLLLSVAGLDEALT